jgi:hypothetical protein
VQRDGGRLTMLFRAPLVEVGEFEVASGWHLQAVGLCRDDICVPLPGSARRGKALDLTLVAQALRMPLVHDADVSLWALGPPVADHALRAAQAPDLVLPDVVGARSFELASLRGKKVLLLAWASW